MASKNKTCGNCDHFERETKGKPGGFCKRYPPKDQKWEITFDSWSCGEFKPKSK